VLSARPTALLNHALSGHAGTVAASIEFAVVPPPTAGTQMPVGEGTSQHTQLRTPLIRAKEQRAG
jgi:hypothetical protein